MNGEVYDKLILEYQNKISECQNDTTITNKDLCVKNNILTYLRQYYQSYFIEFQNEYNSFSYISGYDEDYETYLELYNTAITKFNKAVSNLEKEVDDLTELIAYNNQTNDNYNKLIDERNTEITNTTNKITNINNQISTVEQDIKNYNEIKEIIYIFGIIPISNLPLNVDNLKKLYQLLIIFFLIFFIIILKILKETYI